MLYIVINGVIIGGPLENQLVEGQPSLKELNMKYEYKSEPPSFVFDYGGMADQIIVKLWQIDVVSK